MTVENDKCILFSLSFSLGFCDSKTNCNNEAVCYKVNNDVTCLCKLGYTGSTCSFGK